MWSPTHLLYLAELRAPGVGPDGIRTRDTISVELRPARAFAKWRGHDVVDGILLLYPG